MAPHPKRRPPSRWRWYQSAAAAVRFTVAVRGARHSEWVALAEWHRTPYSDRHRDGGGTSPLQTRCGSPSLFVLPVTLGESDPQRLVLPVTLGESDLRHGVGEFRTAFSGGELLDVGKRRVGDVLECLVGQERLVRRDHDIVERHQPCQHIVGQHLVRNVVKEDARLFFVDVQPRRADPCDFSPSISARVSTRPPRLVLISITPSFIWLMAAASIK